MGPNLPLPHWDQTVGMGPQTRTSTTADVSLDSSRMTADRYRRSMSTRRRTWPMIILVIVAACGCLALGWWQWSRWESATGTFQNLGYALQWPFFAGFCVYAYRKYVRYEQAPPEPRSATETTEIPEGLRPQRPQHIVQRLLAPAVLANRHIGKKRQARPAPVHPCVAIGVAQLRALLRQRAPHHLAKLRRRWIVLVQRK